MNDTQENFISASFNDATLAIDLIEKPEIRVRVINQWENSIKPFFPIFDVIAETHKIIEVKDDSYDLVLDGYFSKKEIKNKNAIKLYYIGEPATPEINKYNLSFGFNHIENENYFRLPLYYIYYGKNISTEYTRDNCNPEKKYFACYLVSNSNKFYDNNKERTDIFHALSEYKFVASGGKHLNNIGYVVPQKDTMNFLSQCKFVIAYENTRSFPGYITEKVFQAYFAGAIPIYYTHPDSLNDINLDAIIAQNSFNSRKEMIDYIKELDQNDEKYCNKWNEKIVKNPQINYDSMLQRLRVKLRDLLALI